MLSTHHPRSQQPSRLLEPMNVTVFRYLVFIINGIWDSLPISQEPGPSSAFLYFEKASAIPFNVCQLNAKNTGHTAYFFN